MEELQSTEILDREILEDARKKAWRILKTADETIKNQNREWEKKTAGNFSELDEKYAELIKTETKKVMARLPVDKQRIKIEKIESLLRSAVENWYKSLSRAQILGLLGGELAMLNEQITKNSGQITEDKEQIAFFSGLERQEAENLLKSANYTYKSEEVKSTDGYPSIVIEKSEVRIIASFGKMIDSLLLEKRAELTETLAGREFLGER